MDSPDERRLQLALSLLPVWQREPAEGIARALLTLGAYRGSESDAVTDAVALLAPIWDYLRA